VGKKPRGKKGKGKKERQGEDSHFFSHGVEDGLITIPLRDEGGGKGGKGKETGGKIRRVSSLFFRRSPMGAKKKTVISSVFEKGREGEKSCQLMLYLEAGSKRKKI